LTSAAKKILGDSPPVRALLALIERVAGSKTNVLVIGESGTGKELVARMIHDRGPLRGKPFIPVNCGAIPETLIESEMFGHKKGSFTGAVGDKLGLFEAASGGTLFLDEVGELPLSMQVKLLRAIQERVIRKVGGTDDIHIDVRIIAATNRDLEAGVAKGTFREDLYYRLNVLLIKTPPLRERRGDVRLLAQVFLRRFADKQGKALTGFAPDALAALEAFNWPGNIRELENIVERAVTLENGTEVSLASLPANVIGAEADAAGTAAPAAGGELRVPAPRFESGPLNLDAILADVERAYLVAALEHAGGVKKRAAELLGITFRSMRYRLKKIGLDADSDEESGE
jgi:two-component system response regulator PilR (NtrC family)